MFWACLVLSKQFNPLSKPEGGAVPLLIMVIIIISSSSYSQT